MRSCRSCNTSFASVVMMVQDSIGSLPAPFPLLPQACEPERSAVAAVDIKRPLLLAAILLPLVKAVGGDEAPTMFKGVAEGGFRRHRLRARV